jgi:hypothetical protein
MNVVLEGKLLQILPQQNGTGKNGPWIKQDFIIETPGEFPKKICVSAWGDKANELSGFKEGNKIKVSVNIESREFNERWYTDVKAWRFERAMPDDSPDEPPPPVPDDIPPFPEDDLPF